MHKRRLALNVLFAFASETVSRGASAVMLLIAARALGPGGTGVYSIGTTLLFVGSRVALWWLDQILMRDVARNYGLTGKYVSNFLLMRLLLSVISAAALSVALWMVLPYAPSSRWPLTVIIWGLVPENIADICRAVFLAHEKSQYVFLINGITTLARVSGAIVVAIGGYGITGLAWVLTGSGMLGMLYGLICLRRCFPSDWQRPDLAFWKSEFAEGASFWAINLVNVLDFQIDTLLLSWLVSEPEVGLYGAGLGVMLALSVLPTTFRLAFFPMIARLFVEDRDGLTSSYRQNVKYLFAIAVPVSVGLFLTADKVIQLLYGSTFAGSVTVLQVLCWSMLFLLTGDMDGRLLLASHNQRRTAVHTAVGLAVNVALNLLLVPRLGIVGAAWARLASNVTVATFNHVFVQRRLVHTNVLPLLWRSGLAAGLMGVVVWGLRGWPLFALVAIGCLVYGALIVSLRGITLGEILRWVRRS